jgi:hypothetical protein
MVEHHENRQATSTTDAVLRGLTDEFGAVVHRDTVQGLFFSTFSSRNNIVVQQVIEAAYDRISPREATTELRVV